MAISTSRSPAPARPAYAPALSQPIATAARAAGDAYPPAQQRWIRVAGVLLAAATAFYLPWLFTSLNTSRPWLVWPFAFANVFTLFGGLLNVFNSWWRSAPEPRLVAVG